MKKRKPKVRTWETSLSLAQMITRFFLRHPFILTHGGTYQPSYVSGEILPTHCRYLCCRPPCPLRVTHQFILHKKCDDPKNHRSNGKPQKIREKSRGFKYAQASPNPIRVARGILSTKAEASQTPMSRQCPQGMIVSPRVMGRRRANSSPEQGSIHN